MRAPFELRYMDGAGLEAALLLGGVPLDDLYLALALIQLGLAGFQPLVGARLELLSPVVELGLAHAQVALELEELAVRVPELVFAAVEQLEPAFDLALAGGDLVAERLLPLGDADPFDLELGSHALLAV